MVLTSSQVSGLYFDPYEAKRIRVHSHFSRAQVLLRMLSCTNSLSFSVQTINFFYLSQVLNHVHLFWNFEIVMILFVYYCHIFVVQIGVSVSGEQKNSTAETVVTTRQVKCEINFIPLVYYKDDSAKTQCLRCRQKLINLRFATCPAPEDFPTRCSDNKPRCDNRGINKPDRYCSHKRCNHAVLVSGGWNSFTSRQRYRRSLHNVWALLHSTMRYRKQFIRTFLGQGQKRERK